MSDPNPEMIIERTSSGHIIKPVEDERYVPRRYYDPELVDSLFPELEEDDKRSMFSLSAAAGSDYRAAGPGMIDQDTVRRLNSFRDSDAGTELSEPPRQSLPSSSTHNYDVDVVDDMVEDIRRGSGITVSPAIFPHEQEVVTRRSHTQVGEKIAGVFRRRLGPGR